MKAILALAPGSHTQAQPISTPSTKSAAMSVLSILACLGPTWLSYKAVSSAPALTSLYTSQLQTMAAIAGLITCLIGARIVYRFGRSSLKGVLISAAVFGLSIGALAAICTG